MALEHDILGQCQHLLECFLHLDELFAFLLDRAAEADSAAEDLVTPVENQVILLNRVRVGEIGILTP